MLQSSQHCIYNIIYRKLSINQTFSLAAAQLLGFNDSIPPYATAKSQDFLGGVNYASGAAGIRDETGKIVVLSFDFVNYPSLTFKIWPLI